MTAQPLTFSHPGHFELYYHHTGLSDLPRLRSSKVVRICVPLGRAIYSITQRYKTKVAHVKNLGTRDILVMPVGQPYTVAWRHTADFVSLYVWKRFIAKVLGVRQLPLDKVFTLRDPLLSAAATLLRSSLRDGKPPSATFAEAIATVIAYRVGIGAQAGARIRPSENVSAFSARQLVHLENFIEKNLEHSISLAALAREMKLSQWHFTRRFHASHGTSPFAFITERRLARAKALLREPNLSITQIALEVGMSHSHFSRSFLRHIGVSPREFRSRELHAPKPTA
jgi:AraC family transcriptional regulator